MIAFVDYARIKNNYCLAYFGYSDEYLVQLKYLAPILNQRFPGLNIFIGCRDDKISIIQDYPNIIVGSELKKERENFGYIRDIRFDGTSHPIEYLLKSSKIESFVVQEEAEILTTKCVIVSEGCYPTKNLESGQIHRIQKMLSGKGFDISINDSIEDAGIVIGVESAPLFEAAAQGIKTKLIPTGIGDWLYKGMFPKGELLRI